MVEAPARQCAGFRLAGTWDEQIHGSFFATKKKKSAGSGFYGVRATGCERRLEKAGTGQRQLIPGNVNIAFSPS